MPRDQYQDTASQNLVPNPKGTPPTQSPRNLDNPGRQQYAESVVQLSSYLFLGEALKTFFLPSITQFLEVLLSLDNLIPLIHESTFQKSSPWVLFSFGNFYFWPCHTITIINFLQKGKKTWPLSWKIKGKITNSKITKDKLLFQ